MKEFKRTEAARSKLSIVGIGPGNVELIPPYVMKSIECCDVLIGGRRNLELFKHLKKEEVAIGSNLEKVCEYILENAGHKSITVLATGDPGIFSISQFLRQRLKDVELEIMPGISSLQYLCSRINTTWNDMAILSLHGREEDNLAAAVIKNQKAAIFTGGGTFPDDVCKRLMREGIQDAFVTVGERLSYPDERIVSGTLEEISRMSFDSLSLMIVERVLQAGQEPFWQSGTPGIPDHLFIRGNIPMTKEEVRTISLSKLRLMEDSIVFDVGAGTGSVSVECSHICGNGKVYAIERDKEAIDLIRKNADRFKMKNICVVEGSAPEVLKGLPVPDRVFIGGTGGCMDEILEWIAVSTKKVRVVLNAISPESVHEALNGLEKHGFAEIELVNVSVSRGCKAGDRHIMKAINPVYIISAVK